MSESVNGANGQEAIAEVGKGGGLVGKFFVAIGAENKPLGSGQVLDREGDLFLLEWRRGEAPFITTATAKLFSRRGWLFFRSEEDALRELRTLDKTGDNLPRAIHPAWVAGQ